MDEDEPTKSDNPTPQRIDDLMAESTGGRIVIETYSARVDYKPIVSSLIIRDTPAAWAACAPYFRAIIDAMLAIHRIVKASK